MTADQFQLVVDIHLAGTFTVSQAALPFLPDDGTGRIINVDLRGRPRRHDRPGQLRRGQGRASSA